MAVAAVAATVCVGGGGSIGGVDVLFAGGEARIGFVGVLHARAAGPVGVVGVTVVVMVRVLGRREQRLGFLALRLGLGLGGGWVVADCGDEEHEERGA